MRMIMIGITQFLKHTKGDSDDVVFLIQGYKDDYEGITSLASNTDTIIA